MDVPNVCEEGYVRWDLFWYVVLFEKTLVDNDGAPLRNDETHLRNDGTPLHNNGAPLHNDRTLSHSFVAPLSNVAVLPVARTELEIFRVANMFVERSDDIVEVVAARCRPNRRNSWAKAWRKSSRGLWQATEMG